MNSFPPVSAVALQCRQLRQKFEPQKTGIDSSNDANTVESSGWLIDRNDGLYILDDHFPLDWNFSGRVKVVNGNIMLHQTSEAYQQAYDAFNNGKLVKGVAGIDRSTGSLTVIRIK